MIPGTSIAAMATKKLFTQRHTLQQIIPQKRATNKTPPHAQIRAPPRIEEKKCATGQTNTKLGGSRKARRHRTKQRSVARMLIPKYLHKSSDKAYFVVMYKCDCQILDSIMAFFLFWRVRGSMCSARVDCSCCARVGAAKPDLPRHVCVYKLDEGAEDY